VREIKTSLDGSFLVIENSGATALWPKPATPGFAPNLPIYCRRGAVPGDRSPEFAAYRQQLLLTQESAFEGPKSSSIGLAEWG
jgi:hypothetical protein